MGLLIALLAAAAAALVFGGKATAAPALPSNGGTAPPAGSEPEGSLAKGSPVVQPATAASGRKYTVWMWPEIPGTGVYTVVQASGTQAWLACVYNKNTDGSTPLKTNVMQLAGMTDTQRGQLLTLIKTDWRLPL